MPNAAQSFDFDRPVVVHRERSMRWSRYRGRDVIALWVADMDFAAPPAVVEAIRAIADQPVYGYAAAPGGVAAEVAAYCRERYGWSFAASAISWLPGLVPGLHVAVRAGAQAGGGVVVMPPVYPPFRSAPGDQGRRVVEIPLAFDAGRYRFDLDALESVLRDDDGIGLLLLCHPHNPVGRAWLPDELEALAERVRRYDLLVCSDEIHCDLLLDPGRRHRPFAMLPGMAERTITLMAPSKTYNVAGLGAGWAVIEDPNLRRRFREAMHGIVPPVSAFGFAALSACVGGQCEAWRQSLLAYLRGNRELVLDFSARVGLPMPMPEASFLAWLDARHVPDAHRRIEAGGVGLSDGIDFGAPGFLRLNFGTQRAVLREALDRVERTLAIG